MSVVVYIADEDGIEALVPSPLPPPQAHEAMSHLPVWVVINVKDTGRGIPPEKKAELFNDFSQLDKSDAAIGTGLGKPP